MVKFEKWGVIVMKKPERLVGYLKLNDSNCAFEFNDTDFTLSLYPQNANEDNIKSVFDGIAGFNYKEHKWIETLRLTGVTSSGNNIIFNVQDIPSSFNGFKVYDVNWYFCYRDTIKSDSIEGFRIKGLEVDLFYPPQRALETKINFSEENHKISGVQVSSGDNSDCSYCGKYRLIKGIDANIELSAYATIHTGTAVNPIDAESVMVTSFSVPVDLDTLIMAYYNTVRFFEYVTYRNNITIDSVDIFFTNENGLRQYDGILVFPNQKNTETDKNVKKRIIGYNFLLNKTSKIFALLNKNKIGFGHICKSIDDTRHYPVSRTIMILTEFEREYRNIYGTDYNRSEEYLDVKNNIVDLISNYLREQHGKRRKYVKQLSRYIADRDNSFEDNVRYALNDCEDIMDIFIKRKYSDNYKSAVDDIAFRVGELRNGIAHSRLDLKLKAISLSDIKIIEELTYAICLKKCGIKSQECKKAINALFGEQFAL